MAHVVPVRDRTVNHSAHRVQQSVSRLADFFGDGPSWRTAAPLVLLAVCFFVILFVATGCPGGLDATAECQTACDRYASCGGDESFDAALCIEQCADQAVGDADFQQRVNTCDSCVEDSDCGTGDDFTCTEECAGVIDR